MFTFTSRAMAAATAATIALGALSVTPASANGSNDNDAAAVAALAGGIIGVIAGLAAGSHHEELYDGPRAYGPAYGYRPLVMDPAIAGGPTSGTTTVARPSCWAVPPCRASTGIAEATPRAS